MRHLFAAVLVALCLPLGAWGASVKPVVNKTGALQNIPAGDTLLLPAPATDGSVILTPGSAPSAPTNGACWTTTAGLFCRIAGVTVGPYGSGGGSGTVTSVSSANGDITVATGTTTPVLTAVSSPKWSTARTLSFTGDATGSGSVDGSASVATALTLATVNSNVGSFTSANITVNAKGLITAASNGSGGGGSSTIVGSQLRLTLVTGVPVMTSDQTAKTHVFATPYVGNQFPLYSGSAWSMVSISSDLDMALDTTNQTSTNLYDLFAYAGPAIGAGPAWSSSTSRGTGAGTTELEFFQGVWVNKNSITLKNGAGAGTSVGARVATYLGTIYCTANGQTGMAFTPAAATGGSNAFLGVWNAYNRVRAGSSSQDSTASWNYASTTWRATDGSSSNRISYVDGLGQSGVDSSIYSVSASGYGNIGVNRDSTSAAPSKNIQFGASTQAAGQGEVSDWFPPSMGFHFMQGMEVAASGTASFQGAGTSPSRQSNGMTIRLGM